MVATSSSTLLETADLPSTFNYVRTVSSPVPAPQDSAGAEENLTEFHHRPPSPVPPLRETEKQAIIEALKHSGGDRAKAAQLLGIGRTTLYRKLKEYQIQN